MLLSVCNKDYVINTKEVQYAMTGELSDVYSIYIKFKNTDGLLSIQYSHEDDRDYDFRKLSNSY